MYTEFVTQSAGQEHTSASYRYRHTHEHFEWESVFSSRHFIYVSAFFMKSQQFFCRCGIFVCILHNTNSTWQFHAMKQKRTDNTMELCWKLRYFWWCTLQIFIIYYWCGLNVLDSIYWNNWIDSILSNIHGEQFAYRVWTWINRNVYGKYSWMRYSCLACVKHIYNDSTVAGNI